MSGITLAEAREHINGVVIYRTPGSVEEGVITSVNDRYVFVCYLGDDYPKATPPENLTLLASYLAEDDQ